MTTTNLPRHRRDPVDELMIADLLDENDRLRRENERLREPLVDIASDHVLLKITSIALMRQLSEANIRNRKLHERLNRLVAELRTLQADQRRAA